VHTRLVLLGLLTALIVALGRIQPEAALSHAVLEEADPAPGAVLKVPPRLVRLRFALSPQEELDPRRSTLAVWGPGGSRVDDGRGGVDLHDLDRRTLIARLRGHAGPGMYAVRWKAVTVPDGGTSQGAFRFTVARAAAP